MKCESNLCNQGRIPCPTRWQCNTHRVFIASTTDGGESVHLEHEPRPLGGGNYYLHLDDIREAPVRVPAWVAWAVVAAVACGLGYLVTL